MKISIIDQLKLVREAKHTMAVFLSSLGSSSYAASGFYVKWPDVIDALLSDDDELFLKDMFVLVCVPFKAIAEGLATHTESRTASKLIVEAIEVASKDLSMFNIIMCKTKLIAICNQEILSISRDGKAMESIKGLEHD